MGDGEGEHHHLHRGGYEAWVHVVIGFIYQALLVSATLGLLVAAGVGAVFGAVSDDHATMHTVMYATAGGIGLFGAWLVFRDRWRCIEAVSSRYCSGLANLSMLYVPVVALVYANYRGVQKLRGA